MSLMRIWSSLLICCLPLTGCAVASVDGERMKLRSAEFATYVEAVFRRQNAVAADIALTLDSEDTDDATLIALEEAELALLAACIGMNELARAQRDGATIGGLAGLKRARQAPECERATNAAVESLGSE